MMILEEGDLRFEFDDAIEALRFDDENHQLTHCMKCVDFIVEFEAFYIFVEVKDPKLPDLLTPGLAQHVADGRRRDLQKFVKKFESGELGRDLVTKFRDSFLYRWAEEKLDKPIYYLMLLELPFIDNALFVAKAEEISRQLPFAAQGQPIARWQKSLVAGCACFGIDKWNERFTKWRVTRTPPPQAPALQALPPTADT